MQFILSQHGNGNEAGFMESQQDYFGEYLQQKCVSRISILLNGYQKKEEREGKSMVCVSFVGE